jgi:signal transduction histidine kinase
MTVIKSQALRRAPGLPGAAPLALTLALVVGVALLCRTAGQREPEAALVAGIFLAVALAPDFVVNVARGVIGDDGVRRRRGERNAAKINLTPGESSRAGQQHHALRRVATLVARGASPAEVFQIIADDLARNLRVDTAAMFRFQTDGTVVLLSQYTTGPKSTAGVRPPLILDGDASDSAMVLRNGCTVRTGSHEAAAGAVAAHLRKICLHSPIVSPIIVENRAWGLLVAGFSREQPLSQHMQSVLGDFADLVAIAIGNAAERKEMQANRDSLAALAIQHEALRRLATLVARGVSPDECFAAVATEMAKCLDVDKAEVFRYEDDGAAVAVACHVSPGTAQIPIGQRITSEDHKIAAELLCTGFASAIDGRRGAMDSVRARLRELGLGSVAGAPIVVDGRLWGMAVVGSTRAKPLPAHTKQRIAEFADLVAAYIAASTTRAELIASRARIVAAADEARRRLERDLHDGAQQRLVSLHLKLRTVVEDVPEEMGVLKDCLTEFVSDLTDATKELQEISRGIHPAVLSKGGLAPALRALANRSSIPATVDIAVEGALPNSVEVAAYYIVAEALTNAAKHSHATEVTVSAHYEDAYLYLSVTDNGIGGANVGKGSGLVGLNDRVEALGGTMTITSIPGSGTSVDVTIPVHTLQAVWSSGRNSQSVLLAR